MQGDVFTDFDVESLERHRPKCGADRGRFVMRTRTAHSGVPRRRGRRQTFLQHFERRHSRTEGELMSNRIGIFALLTGASCAISGVAVAQDQRLAVPLTDPSRPARLEIQLFSGDISVEGLRRQRGRHRRRRPDSRRGPARRRRVRTVCACIQSSSVGLTVEENDNTVSVAHGLQPQERRPPDSSTAADVRQGEPRQRRRRRDRRSVTGEHELSNVNGDVIATDIAGSAVINATNGDVRATFTSVDATKPMSFTSFNGDVDVTLPANLAADLIVGQPAGRRLHRLRRGQAQNRSAERPAERRPQRRQGKSACQHQTALRDRRWRPRHPSCGPSTAT